jgi:Ni/Co efflux regulator RcnB
MKRILLLVLMALMGLSVAAPAAQAQDDEANVRYKKKTEIDFDDVGVDGELKKPHGAYLLDKRQSSFNPLIRLKEDFNQEMVESVNQIR